MRACRAKDLRYAASRNMPQNLSEEARYAPVPRTARIREAVAPQLQADGTIKMVKVSVNTVTFRLAPDCRRYFTQKFKRMVLKHQREVL